MQDKKLLESLKKTNRLYAVISNVNNMILHIKEEDKLFAEACRIAVEEGKFVMSWIGILDEETSVIKPVCFAGHEDGYLKKTAEITIKNSPAGLGPTGQAVRNGKTFVANDFANDPNLILWREEGLKRGYASSIAIPIMVDGKGFGVFSIYASEPQFFNEIEIKQLEALTENIAFALKTMKSEKLLITRTQELENIHYEYVSLLENMTEGIQLIGYDYRYLFLNNSTARQGKIPKEELIGHTMMEKYPGIEGTELFAKIKLCMEKRVPQTFENFFVFPDGKGEWFEIRMSPIPQGVIILSLDITERKKMAEDLELANKAREEEILFSASKMSALGEMASGIAHEINNPLSIIIMKVTQMIRKFQTDTLDQEYLEEGLTKIATTAQRIGKVVKGLSSISRNSQNDPMKKIKLVTVLEETLQLCRERFSTHSIRLDADLDAALELEIECRAPQIMQVFLNLLNNAFDASSLLPERWVKIKAEPSDFGVSISVTDSGHGIPDQIISKIMQPFFTTKEPGKGTGLGLSISKGIIDEHHGRFYYQKSSPHTCFVVELPVAALALSKTN